MSFTPSRFLFSLLSIFLLLAAANRVHAQGEDIWRGVVVEPTKINDTLTLLMAARGGNMALSVGEDGVLLVDDHYAPISQKIKDAIAKLTDQPVKFVLNTHWHGDHTGGNESFAADGAIILAHENVRARMGSEQFLESFNRTVPASPKGALPVITYRSLNLHFNGEDIEVYHVPNAHTDGDSVIHFKGSDVLHMGDTFFNKLYPFIDPSSGGNINGVIAGAKIALERTRPTTRIIPGHGPMCGPGELREFHDMLVVVRDRIQKMIDEGKSQPEIIAAKPTKEYDEVWGQGFLPPDTWVGIVHAGLIRGKK